MKPFFYIGQKGDWSFQCEHEIHRDVYAVQFKKGSIVLCKPCMKKVIAEYNGESK